MSFVGLPFCPGAGGGDSVGCEAKDERIITRSREGKLGLRFGNPQMALMVVWCWP